MSALRATRLAVRRPTESESRMARESSRQLGSVVSGTTKPEAEAEVVVQIKGRPASETLIIPMAALTLFRRILDEMAQGNAVTLTPVHAELTTQEAADLLHVSRPFLIRLLDGKQINYRKVGRHRRIRFDDLMEYKQKTDAQRSEALDELVAQSQELGMG